jgi:uncharacterized membrane protein YjgN (DUF898 family)
MALRVPATLSGAVPMTMGMQRRVSGWRPFATAPRTLYRLRDGHGDGREGDDMHEEILATGAEPAAPQAHVLPTTYPERPFEFRGSGGEYFRIWIVNLALSIVTLGIYSAWASVRTRRYFYANTWLAGSPFEYSAKPLPILRGRLIAAAMFACYVFASRTSPRLQLLTAALIAIVMPWLIVRGLAFRARYSAWRGLPFRFETDTPGAYLWYLLSYLMIPFTMGLAYPYIKARQQDWTVRHHRYGDAGFSFKADMPDYYMVFFATLGIGFLWILGVALIAVFGVALIDVASGSANGVKMHPIAMVVVVYVAYLPAYLGVYAYSRSRMLNLLYNNSELAGGHRLQSTLGYSAMFWIYLSNAVAIIFTLGMAVPWAKVRMVRYRTSHLVLQPAGDLDVFVAETTAQTDVSAVGAEMDSLFSIDIGL